MAKERNRGFEVIEDKHRKHFVDVKLPNGKTQRFYNDVQLPIRADQASAGYDLFMPHNLMLLPAQKTIVYLDVKAYMRTDEVFIVLPRSSMGIKKGLMLGNTIGVIDASYYSNEHNDGNIGLSLLNTSGKGMELKAGDRIAQGIFLPYLTADNDEALLDKRGGGFGSSGE